jgi:hypothetical protein
MVARPGGTIEISSLKRNRLAHPHLVEAFVLGTGSNIGYLDLSVLNGRMCDIGRSKPGRLAYVGKASRLTSFVVWGLKRFYLATADRRLGMTGGIRASLRDAGWCHN